jgi:hypothetical protein
MRELWNRRQQELRLALSGKSPAPARDLFLAQHAMVHTGAVSGAGLHSFEDAVWSGLPDAAARIVPAGMEHSIVWCAWHLTRIEDMVMHVLVAGTDQLWDREGWAQQIGVTVRDTGNAMTPAQVNELSRAAGIPALRAYRAAVGRATREIVGALDPAEYRRKTPAARLQSLQADGSIDAQSTWLAGYWGGLTVAGLLLMPPTRHPFVHHTEALAIRKRAARSNPDTHFSP